MQAQYSRKRVHWTSKYDCHWKAVSEVDIGHTSRTKFQLY